MAANRLILLLLVIVASCIDATAQGKYSVSLAPDLWYNSIDGARIGLRFRGQMAGTFGDGPHRLDAGIWLGSKLPKDPVSYYVSLTEPISAFSDFGSEASVEGFSAIRDGYHSHGFALSKRWQKGFNEKEFTSIRVQSSYSQRYDTRYALLPSMWQSRPVYAVETSLLTRNESNILGSMSHTVQLSVGSSMQSEAETFIQLEVEHLSRKNIASGFAFRHRVFMGLSGAETPIERRYRPSSGKAIDEISSGITRSRGILPQAGIDKGWVHLADGPNLRGYGRVEMGRLLEGRPATVTNIGSLNLELDYPNPVSWVLSRIPVVGGVLNSRMYVFTDHGLANNSVKSNAGAGFTVGLNIPDYLGRSRTLALRYDVPAWLSKPLSNEPKWNYRSVFGIWSVINL
jgi:hypothetical protein